MCRGAGAGPVGVAGQLTPRWPGRPPTLFSSGGSNFVNLTGSANGNTTFLAGNIGGYAFAASGGNDAIDFSAATANPVNVNLAGGNEWQRDGVRQRRAGQHIGADHGDRLAQEREYIHGRIAVRRPTTSPPTAMATRSWAVPGTDIFNSNGSNNRGHGRHGQRHLQRSSGSNNTIDFSALPGG